MTKSEDSVIARMNTMTGGSDLKVTKGPEMIWDLEKSLLGKQVPAGTEGEEEEV